MSISDNVLILAYLNYVPRYCVYSKNRLMMGQRIYHPIMLMQVDWQQQKLIIHK